jgi:hypothetical protein
MTLGNAAARYGDRCAARVDRSGFPTPVAETTVLDRHRWLVCGEYGSRRVDMVVTGTERP